MRGIRLSMTMVILLSLIIILPKGVLGGDDKGFANAISVLIDGNDCTNDLGVINFTNNYTGSFLLCTLQRIMIMRRMDATISSCTIRFNADVFLMDAQLQTELQHVLSKLYPIQWAEALKSSGNIHNPRIAFLYSTLIPALCETPSMKKVYKTADSCGFETKVHVLGGEKIQIRHEQTNGTKFCNPDVRIYGVFGFSIRKKRLPFRNIKKDAVGEDFSDNVSIAKDEG